MCRTAAETENGQEVSQQGAVLQSGASCLQEGCAHRVLRMLGLAVDAFDVLNISVHLKPFPRGHLRPIACRVSTQTLW